MLCLKSVEKGQSYSPVSQNGVESVIVTHCLDCWRGHWRGPFATHVKLRDEPLQDGWIQRRDADDFCCCLDLPRPRHLEIQRLKNCRKMADKRHIRHIRTLARQEESYIRIFYLISTRHHHAFSVQKDRFYFLFPSGQCSTIHCWMESHTFHCPDCP